MGDDEQSLELAGPLDVRTTRELRAAIYALLAVPGRVVVIDFSKVTSADVVALRVIAVATRHATNHGSRLVLRSVPAPVRRLLAISRLNRVVEVVPDGVPESADGTATPGVSIATRETT